MARALLQASGSLSTTAVLLIIAGALLGAVSLVFTARVYSMRQRELVLGRLHRGKEADDPEFGPLGLASPPREWAKSISRMHVEAQRQEAAAAEAAANHVDSPADAPFFYPHVLEGGRWKQAVPFKKSAKPPPDVGKMPSLMSMPMPYASPALTYGSARSSMPEGMEFSPPRAPAPRPPGSAQRLW